MAANNLTNKLKVFAEATTNKLDDTAFAVDSQRQDGYQPNQIISSKITNTILRQTSVVTTALVEALKELSEKNLTNAMTFGSDTILADAKTAIKEALVNVKVTKAVLADNVVGGALVEETNIARKFKAGWQISQEFKEKMVFKGTWTGTYINNDIIYYGTAGPHKGYYVVHGLTKESVDELSGVITPAQTLTIKSGNTPGTLSISGNLKRLTYENIVTTVNGSSTNSELPTGKAVYNFVDNGYIRKTMNLQYISNTRISEFTVDSSYLTQYSLLMIEFYDKDYYYDILADEVITIPNKVGVRSHQPQLFFTDSLQQGDETVIIVGSLRAQIKSNGDLYIKIYPSKVGSAAFPMNIRVWGL